MCLLIGVAAGALTGVPIGPANVAVIDAAYRHTLRRALAVSAGAAIADGLCAAGSVLGVKRLLEAYPSVPPILFAFSGVVLLVYGFLTARSQPVAPAAQPEIRSSDTGLIRKELRTWSLQQQRAAERYRDFLDQYPDLAQRVPQYHIASYLGVTEVSLSRLKRSLAEAAA